MAHSVGVEILPCGAMEFFCLLVVFLGCCSVGSSGPSRKINNVIQKASTPPNPANPQYIRWITSALMNLQGFYNESSGLWGTTGWWNNANIVTMLADYSLVNGLSRPSNIPQLQNTLTKASQNQPQMVRIINSITSSNTFVYPDIPGGLALPDPSPRRGYLNEYYDDEGWWALAWIKAYDLTSDVRYINTAIEIFDDMTQGYPAKCGGIWWDKSQTANVAITNELFLTVAAQLANRAANRGYYLQWALTQWKWFEDSGLINAQGNVNDGIELSTCQNNGGYVWSHNQGVIIGGLLELYQANANNTYILIAQNIASAAIATLSDRNGTLREKCEPYCGNDAPQFKGVLMRNFRYLQQSHPSYRIRAFIENNANTIWKNQGLNQSLGLVWSGPPGPETAATQSAALDALVAALAVG